MDMYYCEARVERFQLARIHLRRGRAPFAVVHDHILGYKRTCNSAEMSSNESMCADEPFSNVDGGRDTESRLVGGRLGARGEACGFPT